MARGTLLSFLSALILALPVPAQNLPCEDPKWNEISKEPPRQEQKSANYQPRPKVIAINPGHGPIDSLGFGAIGKDAREYQLNLKMAGEIREEFQYDNRFNVVLVKDEGHFNSCLESKITNQEKLIQIKKTMKLIPPEKASALGVKHKSKNKAMKSYILPMVYSTRLTMESDHDIDLIIDPHFDAPDSTRAKLVMRGEVLSDSGFSILMPLRTYCRYDNERFALSLSNQFSRVNNVSTSRINDDIPDFPKLKEGQKDLEKKGIVYRRWLPELGDIRYPSTKPLLMVEYGWALKQSINDDEYFRKMAHATYLGILDYFGFNLISMDNKFVLELNKTPYQHSRFFINEDVRKVCNLSQ